MVEASVSVVEVPVVDTADVVVVVAHSDNVTDAVAVTYYDTVVINSSAVLILLIF